ncbi:MAG: hypothetical protein K2I54_08635 [Muribaculaceae bacterium]|nr:hypothetical protein [Muribaculaceae bacterium]
MNFADRFFNSLKSIAKVAAQSRKCSVRQLSDAHRIIIMGNGPSLNETIEAHADVLQRMPTMAVNFAANAPVFREIRPRFYVLADPYFFSGADDSNLKRLWKEIESIDWPCTLYVPATMRKKANAAINSQYVSVEGFNAVGAEGFESLCHFFFRHGLAMPRPRNVLIPAIMLAIHAGFKIIDIVGADHSWMKTLSVTDDNEVVSIQEHFYSDNAEEKARVRHEYRGYNLYHIVESFGVAFKSYIDIKAFADKKGVKIFNCTPGSFIDAFPRRKLE